MLTRRELIHQSLMGGAWLAIASGCTYRRQDHLTVDPTLLEGLQRNFSGQIILPSNQAYERARAVFWRNSMNDKRPIVIARCAALEDVVRTLEFAQQLQVPVAVRGGGHSFVGWGTCDDGVVIDLSLMKRIEVDPMTGTAKAAAGVLTGELVAATGPYDLVPVLGQCPTVGISGLTLGGGLGWLSGKHGAACDSLLAAEVVTADGHVVLTSPNEHPDLFWAIRGGGGNFGVVTSLTYRLHPLSEVIAGTISYQLRDARSVLHSFSDLMARAPDEFQATVVLSHGEEPAVHVSVCWSGELGDGNEMIGALRTVASPISDTVERVPYMETFRMIRADSPGTGTSQGCYLQRLTKEAVETILDRFAAAPGPGVAIGLDHYMHGAVCRVDGNATAFELRAPGALHVWIQARWDNAAASLPLSTWVEDTWNALRVHSAGRVYANYPAFGSETAVRAVYSDNYSRVVAVKNQYDPGNVFRRNFNILPTA